MRKLDVAGPAVEVGLPLPTNDVQVATQHVVQGLGQQSLAVAVALPLTDHEHTAIEVQVLHA